MIDALHRFTGLDSRVIAMLLIIIAALAVGTGGRVAWAYLQRDAAHRAGLDSLKSWWVLLLLVTGAVAWGLGGVVCLMATASLLGLHEFFRCAKAPRGRFAEHAAAAVVVLWGYACVWLEWREAFLVGVPLLACLLVPLPTVLAGRVDRFVCHAGGGGWFALLLGFCLPHAAWLMTLDDAWNPRGGAAGLFLFLVILTTLNDIAQALWGRRWGRHAVTPVVSPHKTWEGLLLGVATTLVLAVAAAPWLTPFAGPPPSLVATAASGGGGSLVATLAAAPGVWASGAGIVIAVGGFLGDITMSAVKRDFGVKDSGTLLPGQGGILDRIDSLIFTAPLFFYYVWVLYRPPA